MKIKTSVDKHEDLIYALFRLIKYNPLGNEFEDSYKMLRQVLLSNISENKEDLVVSYLRGIELLNNEMQIPLNSASEREKAFFNAGKIVGICDLIKDLGNYDKCLEKFSRPYLELKVGDIVYIKNNGTIYKTVVTKIDKKKIQVKYGNRWFSLGDYLECIFPYEEKDNLYKNDMLTYNHNCDKCNGFRQGKCAYGYSVSTYPDYSYRFDNTKYKIIKGRPQEYCCKKVNR